MSTAEAAQVPVAPAAPAAAASPAAAPRSIKSAALHASAWTLGGYAVGQIIRLGGNVAMTRLLFPEAFGLATLVSTFLFGLAMFSDIGAGPAIVQSASGDDPRFLNTAWTLQCIRGVVLFLGTCALAWPVAAFYGQPMVLRLLPAVGSGAILSGFCSTSLHQAQRHMRVQWHTLADIGDQVANIAVTVGLGVVFRARFQQDHLVAVWALIAGGVAGNLVRLILTHTVVPGIRHRFLLDRDSLKQLFGFGRWVFVSTLVMFLATESDRLLFAKVIPLQMLGVYGVALALAALPAVVAQRIGRFVLFPAYSRFHARGDFADQFERTRLPILLAGATLVTGLIAAGPSFIRTVYDTRYSDATWILPILAVAAWFQILESSVSNALLAEGRPHWMAANNAARLVVLAVALPLGFHLGGFRGALFGIVVADTAKYATAAVGISQGRLRAVAVDLGLTALIAALSYAITTSGHLFGGGVQGMAGHLLRFLVCGTATVAAWAVVSLGWWRRARSAARNGG